VPPFKPTTEILGEEDEVGAPIAIHLRGFRVLGFGEEKVSGLWVMGVLFFRDLT